MKNLIRNLKNKFFPSFRINTTLFGKIYCTWTSKKLSLSEKNVSHIINRFYPAYILSAKIPGCFVECGVGYGRSALIMESILRMHNDNRDFLLFDSFEGFPTPSGEDLSGSEKARKSQWNYIDPDHLIEVLSASSTKRIDIKKYKKNISKRIHIEKGFFEKTFNKEIYNKIKSFKGISYLHLDVDLYNSYLTCLNFLYPLVNSGGLILFDEYDNETLKKFPGSKKAIDKFLLSQNLDPAKVLEYDHSGKCFMVKK
ncbi:MAG: TylF/MycF family methyltransferase [Prochlorococcus marinus CUG1439]|uniref:TylF/MycF/NovP-related O-methyltransferase n=1 Tax=Prochlorococcus sp. MIT 1314 TaxID=3096220 RepID=UPI001B2463C2|nr:TylF/MycF/NovP-related O-methyltransferase [Prochlorococcus sp. MIT 1314]MCR8538812.1 TylF/MycF family methyltransferase [Prochlorococcus marinus CUG1439]